MTSQKIRQYLTFSMQNSYAAVNIAHKIVKKKSEKYGSHTAPSYSYSL